jgi:uncharacterized protein YjbI with pentapeptide repeats
VPADKDLKHVKIKGADLSSCDLSGVNLSSADLSGAKLLYANLKGANLINAQLQGADLSSCDLSVANLSSADLRGANLSNANMKSVNLTNAKLHDARLPAWSSGLLEGVKLAGAEGWVPADKDLSKAKLKGADLSGADLRDADLSAADLSGANLTNAKLHNALLPPWSRGLLEGVKLAGAEGWVPANKDLKNARLKGADLSKCDLSGADLTGADLREAKLEGTTLRDATLCAALLHAAQGARPATTLPVPGPNNNLFTASSSLKVGQPVVFALTAPRALTLQRVTLCSQCGDGQHDSYCAKAMEVQTGPSATGPWTSVVKFTSRHTKQEQTFAAAPDAPLLAGFVQVLVHDTYGGAACVTSMALEGEGWG